MSKPLGPTFLRARGTYRRFLVPNDVDIEPKVGATSAMSPSAACDRFSPLPFIIDKETNDDHVKNAEMLDLPQTQLVDLSKRLICGDISGSAAGGKLDAFRN